MNPFASSTLSSVVPRTGEEKPSEGMQHGRLYAATKDNKVRLMFNRIAGRYDLLNDCISFGMHRLWKRSAVDMLQVQPGDQILDVCTGTGDMVKYLLPKVTKDGKVVGVDFSEDMLAVARERFEGTPHAEFIQGDALKLDIPNNTMDGAMISFGLRNVVDIPGCIREMTRVVKPGGWVVNLDTCPDPKMPGYWFYFNNVMPLVGKALSLDPNAYKYLSESTQHFLSPTELEAVFQEAGLQTVQHKTHSFDSVAAVAGQK